MAYRSRPGPDASAQAFARPPSAAPTESEVSMSSKGNTAVSLGGSTMYDPSWYAQPDAHHAYQAPRHDDDHLVVGSTTSSTGSSLGPGGSGAGGGAAALLSPQAKYGSPQSSSVAKNGSPQSSAAKYGLPQSSAAKYGSPQSSAASKYGSQQTSAPKYGSKQPSGAGSETRRAGRQAGAASDAPTISQFASGTIGSRSTPMRDAQRLATSESDARALPSSPTIASGSQPTTRGRTDQRLTAAASDAPTIADDGSTAGSQLSGRTFADRRLAAYASDAPSSGRRPFTTVTSAAASRGGQERYGEAPSDAPMSLTAARSTGTESRSTQGASGRRQTAGVPSDAHSGTAMMTNGADSRTPKGPYDRRRAAAAYSDALTTGGSTGAGGADSRASPRDIAASGRLSAEAAAAASSSGAPTIGSSGDVEGRGPRAAADRRFPAGTAYSAVRTAGSSGVDSRLTPRGFGDVRLSAGAPSDARQALSRGASSSTADARTRQSPTDRRLAAAPGAAAYSDAPTRPLAEMSSGSIDSRGTRVFADHRQANSDFPGALTSSGAVSRLMPAQASSAAAQRQRRSPQQMYLKQQQQQQQYQKQTVSAASPTDRRLSSGISGGTVTPLVAERQLQAPGGADSSHFGAHRALSSSAASVGSADGKREVAAAPTVTPLRSDTLRGSSVVVTGSSGNYSRRDAEAQMLSTTGTSRELDGRRFAGEPSSGVLMRGTAASSSNGPRPFVDSVGQGTLSDWQSTPQASRAAQVHHGSAHVGGDSVITGNGGSASSGRSRADAGAEAKSTLADSSSGVSYAAAAAATSAQRSLDGRCVSMGVSPTSSPSPYRSAKGAAADLDTSTVVASGWQRDANQSYSGRKSSTPVPAASTHLSSKGTRVGTATGNASERQTADSPFTGVAPSSLVRSPRYSGESMASSRTVAAPPRREPTQVENVAIGVPSQASTAMSPSGMRRDVSAAGRSTPTYSRRTATSSPKRPSASVTGSSRPSTVPVGRAGLTVLRSASAIDDSAGGDPWTPSTSPERVARATSAVPSIDSRPLWLGQPQTAEAGAGSGEFWGNCEEGTAGRSAEFDASMVRSAENVGGSTPTVQPSRTSQLQSLAYSPYRSSGSNLRPDVRSAAPPEITVDQSFPIQDEAVPDVSQLWGSRGGDYGGNLDDGTHSLQWPRGSTMADRSAGGMTSAATASRTTDWQSARSAGFSSPTGASSGRARGPPSTFRSDFAGTARSSAASFVPADYPAAYQQTDAATLPQMTRTTSPPSQPPQLQPPPQAPAAPAPVFSDNLDDGTHSLQWPPVSTMADRSAGVMTSAATASRTTDWQSARSAGFSSPTGASSGRVRGPPSTFRSDFAGTARSSASSFVPAGYPAAYQQTDAATLPQMTRTSSPPPQPLPQPPSLQAPSSPLPMFTMRTVAPSPMNFPAYASSGRFGSGSGTRPSSRVPTPARQASPRMAAAPLNIGHNVGVETDLRQSSMNAEYAGVSDGVGMSGLSVSGRQYSPIYSGVTPTLRSNREAGATGQSSSHAAPSGRLAMQQSISDSDQLLFSASVPSGANQAEAAAAASLEWTRASGQPYDPSPALRSVGSSLYGRAGALSPTAQSYGVDASIDAAPSSSYGLAAAGAATMASAQGLSQPPSIRGPERGDRSTPRASAGVTGGSWPSTAVDSGGYGVVARSVPQNSIDYPWADAAFDTETEPDAASRGVDAASLGRSAFGSNGERWRASGRRRDFDGSVYPPSADRSPSFSSQRDGPDWAGQTSTYSSFDQSVVPYPVEARGVGTSSANSAFLPRSWTEAVRQRRDDSAASAGMEYAPDGQQLLQVFPPTKPIYDNSRTFASPTQLPRRSGRSGDSDYNATLTATTNPSMWSHPAYGRHGWPPRDPNLYEQYVQTSSRLLPRIYVTRQPLTDERSVSVGSSLGARGSGETWPTPIRTEDRAVDPRSALTTDAGSNQLLQIADGATSAIREGESLLLAAHPAPSYLTQSLLRPPAPQPRGASMGSVDTGGIVPFRGSTSAPPESIEGRERAVYPAGVVRSTSPGFDAFYSVGAPTPTDAASLGVGGSQWSVEPHGGGPLGFSRAASPQYAIARPGERSAASGLGATERYSTSPTRQPSFALKLDQRAISVPPSVSEDRSSSAGVAPRPIERIALPTADFLSPSRALSPLSYAGDVPANGSAFDYNNVGVKLAQAIAVPPGSVSDDGESKSLSTHGNDPLSSVSSADVFTGAAVSKMQALAPPSTSLNQRHLSATPLTEGVSRVDPSVSSAAGSAKSPLSNSYGEAAYADNGPEIVKAVYETGTGELLESLPDKGQGYGGRFIYAEPSHYGQAFYEGRNGTTIVGSDSQGRESMVTDARPTYSVSRPGDELMGDTFGPSASQRSPPQPPPSPGVQSKAASARTFNSTAGSAASEMRRRLYGDASGSVSAYAPSLTDASSDIGGRYADAAASGRPSSDDDSSWRRRLAGRAALTDNYASSRGWSDGQASDVQGTGFGGALRGSSSPYDEGDRADAAASARPSSSMYASTGRQDAGVSAVSRNAWNDGSEWPSPGLLAPGGWSPSRRTPERVRSDVSSARGSPSLSPPSSWSPYKKRSSPEGAAGATGFPFVPISLTTPSGSRRQLADGRDEAPQPGKSVSRLPVALRMNQSVDSGLGVQYRGALAAPNSIAAMSAKSIQAELPQSFWTNMDGTESKQELWPNDYYGGQAEADGSDDGGDNSPLPYNGYEQQPNLLSPSGVSNPESNAESSGSRSRKYARNNNRRNTSASTFADDEGGRWGKSNNRRNTSATGGSTLGDSDEVSWGKKNSRRLTSAVTTVGTASGSGGGGADNRWGKSNNRRNTSALASTTTQYSIDDDSPETNASQTPRQARDTVDAGVQGNEAVYDDNGRYYRAYQNGETLDQYVDGTDNFEPIAEEYAIEQGMLGTPEPDGLNETGPVNAANRTPPPLSALRQTEAKEMSDTVSWRPGDASVTATSRYDNFDSEETDMSLALVPRSRARGAGPVRFSMKSNSRRSVTPRRGRSQASSAVPESSRREGRNQSQLTYYSGASTGDDTTSLSMDTSLYTNTASDRDADRFCHPNGSMLSGLFMIGFPLLSAVTLLIVWQQRFMMPAGGFFAALEILDFLWYFLLS